MFSYVPMFLEIFNNYQEVCKLEGPGNIGQSVVLQVKLPKCWTTLSEVEAVSLLIWCHGVMVMDVIVVLMVMLVSIIALLVMGWCL